MDDFVKQIEYCPIAATSQCESAATYSKNRGLTQNIGIDKPYIRQAL